MREIVEERVQKRKTHANQKTFFEETVVVFFYSSSVESIAIKYVGCGSCIVCHVYFVMSEVGEKIRFVLLRHV